MIDMAQDISTGPNGEIISEVFGDITAEVTQALCDDNEFANVTRERKEQWEAEARAMAAEAKALGMDRAKMTKVGLLKGRIPEDMYCAWQRKLGANCWNDPDLVAYILKHFGDVIGVKYAGGENRVSTMQRLERKAQKKRIRGGRIFDAAGNLLPGTGAPTLSL